jgi:hypothetical protein
MSVRVAIWKVEAKLIGLLLMEASALALLLATFVAEGAAFPAYIWGASLAGYFRIVEIGAAGAFVFAVYYDLASTIEQACDEPLREYSATGPS